MKYLIVKTSALGDLLHCFPLITYLKNKSPYGEIHWLVEEKFAPLVQAHPKVDRVIPVKRMAKVPFAMGLRETRYDLLFDLQGNCKSGLLTLFCDARVKVGFAWRDLPEWPNGLVTHLKFPLQKGLNIRQDYLHLAQSYFGDFEAVNEEPFLFPIDEKEREEISPFAGGTLVCSGSAWPSKRLRMNDWREVLKAVEGKIYFVWGSKAERDFASQLSDYGTLLPKLSLAQLQNLMAMSKKVIAMDSLPLHLAATAGTPSFGYFGPSSLDKYLPPGSEGRQGSCPFDQRFEKRCPRLRSCSAPCMSLKTRHTSRRGR